MHCMLCRKKQKTKKNIAPTVNAKGGKKIHHLCSIKNRKQFETFDLGPPHPLTFSPQLERERPCTDEDWLSVGGEISVYTKAAFGWPTRLGNNDGYLGVKDPSKQYMRIGVRSCRNWLRYDTGSPVIKAYLWPVREKNHDGLAKPKKLKSLVFISGVSLLWWPRTGIQRFHWATLSGGPWALE